MVIPFSIIVKIICLVNVPSKKILNLLKNVILTYVKIFIFSNLVAQTETFMIERKTSYCYIYTYTNPFISVGQKSSNEKTNANSI